MTIRHRRTRPVRLRDRHPGYDAGCLHYSSSAYRDVRAAGVRNEHEYSAQSGLGHRQRPSRDRRHDRQHHPGDRRPLGRPLPRRDHGRFCAPTQAYSARGPSMLRRICRADSGPATWRSPPRCRHQRRGARRRQGEPEGCCVAGPEATRAMFALGPRAAILGTWFLRVVPRDRCLRTQRSGMPCGRPAG